MKSYSSRRWLRGAALGLSLGLGSWNLLPVEAPWATSVRAESPGIAWMTNLEQARQVAAAQGRPILIHFWNDNCPPCVAVERNVFSRPEVARALAGGFVAVKIKVDDAPEVAKWYRIDRWPVDIVLTSDGRELFRAVSPQDPQRYIAMLTQAGANAVAKSQVPEALNTINQTVASAVPGSAAMPGGGSFVPPGGGATANSFQQAAAAQVQAAFGAQAGPYQGAAAGFGAAQGVSAAAAGGFGQAPAAPSASFVSAPPPQTPPPGGNPPLGLDGYCTVSLMEQHQWKRGDARWGAIHRDRTYLFCGPEEQQKFLANPDRYAPMLSGFDPVLFAQHGKLVSGRRQHGVWFQDQMFLFVDEASLERFRSSPASFAGTAEQAMRAAAHGGSTMR